jgi:hypothetical protein
LDGWLNIRNLKAVSLALLLFIYPILVLSSASVRYIETIHRVSLGQIFNHSLFGSPFADSLAALGFMLLFVSVAFRSTTLRLASVAAFAVGMVLYFSSPGILHAVGIATLPSLITSFVVVAIANRKSTAGGASKSSVRTHFDIDIYRVASAFLVIIIILEIGALARWITYPVFPTEIYGDPSWSFAKLESALFHSLGLLSPFLVVLIAFSFFYKWFILDVLKRMARALMGKSDSGTSMPSAKLFETKQGPTKSSDQQGPRGPPYGEAEAPVVATYATKSSTLARNAHWMILAAALVIAPLLAIYPHLPGVNPPGMGISTDEQYYMNWMSKLRVDGGSTWVDTIARAFTINNGDRPLTLLLILAIANVVGTTDLMVVRFLPVALAPILVLANYLLLRYALRSTDKGRLKLYAAIGAIFAVFSPQIVVGQYAGFLANWMALIATFFALYFLMKGWDSQNRSQVIRSFSILFAILVVTMLVHLYTWAHTLTIILLFGGISYVFARKSVPSPKFKLIFMLVVVATAVSIDYARSSYLSTPAAAESDSALATNIMPQEPGGRWDRLFFTMSTYVGGFLSNPVLLLLALFWIVGADMSKGFDRLFLTMFFILAFPIAFGSIEFQTRVLYNIPFHLAALLAIHSSSTKRYSNTKPLLVIAIMSVMAVYALRAMANLYLQLPEGFVLDKQFLVP